MRATSLLLLVLITGCRTAAPRGSAGPAAAPAAPAAPAAETGWTPLYKGSFDDFRIYFRGQGFIADPKAQDVFVAEPGQIHVRKGTNGLVVTKSSYGRYHVRVDYRWGAPDGSENAGLMTHVDLASTAIKDNRPRSIEINMIRSAPGTILFAQELGPFGSTFVKPGTTEYLPEPDGGQSHHASPFGQRTVKPRYPGGTSPEKPYGDWNRMEAVVRGAESVEVILNGVVVNRVHDIRLPKGGERVAGDPNTDGGIGLQSEGHEIYYRNFEIRPL
jgi:hypothetical protein